MSDMPRLGHPGFYWTVHDPVTVDEPQVRLWTGYSWLEAGLERHLAPHHCRVIGAELEPPEVPPEGVS